MKKIALVVALATSAVMAAPFNGFSVGGSVGATFTKYQPKIKPAGYTDQSKTNFLISLFTGYTRTFDNMIAGADFGINYEKISFKASGIDKLRSLGLSISPRIGYKFDETTAGYFKLGFGFSRINFNDNLKTIGFKPDMFSITPALGVEKFFNENLSVRGEVGYKFEKVKTKDNTIAKISVDSVKKNAVVATVGLSYTF